MNLKDYTNSALKTESIIDQINTNETQLLAILNILIGAGNMLDDYKKHIFYDRPIDNNKFFKSSEQVKHGYFDLNLVEAPGQTELVDQNSLIDSKIEIDPRIFHGIVGMHTESTELLEALVKAIETGELDKVNVGEETSDSNWYQAILLDALGQSWQKMLETNIKKLEDRYNDSFSNDSANNRDLKSEREVLENGIK